MSRAARWGAAVGVIVTTTCALVTWSGTGVLVSVQTPMVTGAEFEGWKTELGNWGRWGADDQMGATNLITPEKRRQAAALVRDGVTVSLAGDVNTVEAEDNGQPYEHVMNQAGARGASDRLAVSFHGYAHTHIDAFAHRFFDGKMWNGVS